MKRWLVEIVLRDIEINHYGFPNRVVRYIEVVAENSQQARSEAFDLFGRMCYHYPDVALTMKGYGLTQYNCRSGEAIEI